MKILNYDAIIIGAGGAGLMCAIEAGKRGRKVCVLDHASEVGNKILISGGGRCNFTNINASAENYQSANKYFIKSAFSQFTPQDFINMVESYNIDYHEKKLGQLFCDKKSSQIIDMLLNECKKYAVDIHLDSEITDIKHNDNYTIITNKNSYKSNKLVIATGGLSIPKIGATNFGYKIAKQFGLKITETTPALVPFTFSTKDLELYNGLSGISFDAIVKCGTHTFRENVLMTHRGVSGPAILQISSYWKAGDEINIHILPDVNFQEILKQNRSDNPKQELKTILSTLLPKRMIERFIEVNLIKNQAMNGISDKEIHKINELFTNFIIKPNGTEGYRKAEVTLGGIDTNELNAKTLESKKAAGLYFIGEVVDITGWLGGYNFQWAWASGFSAGQDI
jgi:hypothetical protein